MPGFIALESPKKRIITQTHAMVEQDQAIWEKYLFSLQQRIDKSWFAAECLTFRQQMDLNLNCLITNYLLLLMYLP